MKKKLINSQMSNFATYLMYKRQFLTLAENVFEFKNMPKEIDISYFNSSLLRKGAIAFFYDEIVEQYVALPFFTRGIVDMYGRPTTIEVYGQNGYRRKLTPNECLRFMGFENFKIVVDDKVAYRQSGNSIAVPVLKQIVKSIYDVIDLGKEE